MIGSVVDVAVVADSADSADFAAEVDATAVELVVSEHLNCRCY